MHDAIVNRIVCSKIRNPDWRQDASQDAWVNLIRATKGEELPSALVARITINACYSFLRQRRHDPIFFACVDAGRTDHPTGGFNLDLWSFIQGQPTQQRQQLLEFVTRGEVYKDFDELAKRFGTSKATVSRTLTSLRRFLREY